MKLFDASINNKVTVGLDYGGILQHLSGRFAFDFTTLFLSKLSTQ